VIDEFAKQYLHDELRCVRGSLLRKLDGLSEYDIRRPLTRTGTNLLGLVKHLTLSEWRYFGSTFNRPFPGPVPSFDHPGYANRDYLWVPEGKSRAQVIDGYERARGCHDRRIVYRVAGPRALVAAARREAVQRPGSRHHRDPPARRAR